MIRVKELNGLFIWYNWDKVCDGRLEELVNFKRILRCFELMSGLRINYHKSLVCGVGVSEDLLNMAQEKMNCVSRKLPIKYLGPPLGASPRLGKTWSPVVDAFKKRLAGWKRKFLSYGGRLALIKSTLASLPIYYLSMFRLSVSVAKVLNSIQARFLWGDTDLKRKVHLVKWEVCHAPDFKPDLWLTLRFLIKIRKMF